MYISLHYGSLLFLVDFNDGLEDFYLMDFCLNNNLTSLVN